MGPRITVRLGSGDIPLILRAAPPDRLVVERLAMVYQGHRIFVQGGQTDFVSAAVHRINLGGGHVVNRSSGGAGIRIYGGNMTFGG